MRKNNNAGFSLIEVLVAITVLALCVGPVCSALVLSHRINAKTDELMRSQLAVSSAVETLMAEGIPKGTSRTDRENDEDYGKVGDKDRFPDTIIIVEPDASGLYFNVTVKSNDGAVEVKTTIRAVQSEQSGGEGT